jgi:hypothetical protein
MYLFQCMLNAFSDDEADVWHGRVDDACRVLLLTAYLGVDAVDVRVFECFFRRGGQDDGWCLRMVDCVRSALQDFIVRCEEDCVIVFQPFYMDVFRRSLLFEIFGTSAGDDDEASGSFQEFFNMVKQDSRHSSHLRQRTNKLKHSQLFQRCELALSTVKGLATSGLQMLRDLDGTASAVPFSVWHGLLECAMHGES